MKQTPCIWTHKNSDNEVKGDHMIAYCLYYKKGDIYSYPDMSYEILLDL